MSVKPGRISSDLAPGASKKIFYPANQRNNVDMFRIFNSGEVSFEVTSGGSKIARLYPRCSIDIDPRSDVALADSQATAAVRLEAIYEYFSDQANLNDGIRQGRFNFVGTAKVNSDNFFIALGQQHGGGNRGGIYRVLNSGQQQLDLKIGTGGGARTHSIDPRESLDFCVEDVVEVTSTNSEGIYLNLTRDDLSAGSGTPAGRFKILAGGAKKTVVDLEGLGGGRRAFYRIFNSSDTEITATAGGYSVTLGKGDSADFDLTNRQTVEVDPHSSKIVEGSLEFLGVQ